MWRRVRARKVLWKDVFHFNIRIIYSIVLDISQALCKQPGVRKLMARHKPGKGKKRKKKCDETIPRQPTKDKKEENQFEKPKQITFFAVLLFF